MLLLSMKLKMEYIAETSIGSTTIGDVGNSIAGVAGKSIIEATAVAIPEWNIFNSHR